MYLDRRLRRQRGSALMTSLIILSGLLVAAGASVYLMTAETRSTSYTAMARRSLFCAEGGLAMARPIVAANNVTWNAVLDNDPSNDPPWYPITGYLEANSTGTPDFTVTLRDNDDEPITATNDPTVDYDLQVFLVSKCTRYPEHPRTVMELVEYTHAGHNYRNQAGQGGMNTGNAN
jgi:hypothetical protein